MDPEIYKKITTVNGWMAGQEKDTEGSFCNTEGAYNSSVNNNGVLNSAVSKSLGNNDTMSMEVSVGEETESNSATDYSRILSDIISSDIISKSNLGPIDGSLTTTGSPSVTITGTGTGWPSNISPLTPYPWYPSFDNTPDNSSDSIPKEELRGLLSEIEDKDEECDDKINKLFEQMKEDRSKTAIIIPMFQYYVGMKEGLDILIRKIKKYLKTDED